MPWHSVPPTLEAPRTRREETVDTTAHALRSDFELGVTDGRKYRRHNQSIPALEGGAYAVGFLFGYQGERRRRSSRPAAQVDAA